MKIAKVIIFGSLVLMVAQNGFAGVDKGSETITANIEKRIAGVTEHGSQSSLIVTNNPEMKSVSQYSNETEMPEKTAVDAKHNYATNSKSEQSKCEAWQQYCIAKNSKEASVRSESYAEAIKHLNDAISYGGESPDVLLLGSRIYRGVGGISYAKQYFSKAAAIYLDDVLRNPKAIEANLKAAIILYAGDVRYWDTYDESKKKARVYADKVLELYNNKQAEKMIQTSEELYLEEAAALAFLVKENVSDCEVHFAKAERIWNKDVDRNNSKLIKRIESDFQDITNRQTVSKEQNISGGGNSYKPYALFKEYPQQGKWLWPVSKPTEAHKEFLLNCLTGFYLKI